MPTGLKRYYGGGDAHFITCSRNPVKLRTGRRTVAVEQLSGLALRPDRATRSYPISPAPHGNGYDA